MTPERWRQVTALFHAALACDPPGRPVHLDEACRDDVDVRHEVERLLAAHDRAGRFGEVPIVPRLDDRSADDASAPPSTLIGAPAAHPAGTRPLEAAPAHRTRDPFFWLMWLVAIITSVAFIGAAAFLVQHGGRTVAFGWNEARQGQEWFVSQVDPAGPAWGKLQEGDRLIAVDGIPSIRGAGTRPHRLRLVAPRPYAVTVERRGERLDVVVPAAAGPDVLGSRLMYFAFSLVWCLFGLFIGLARPDRPVARLASAAAVMMGLGFLNTAFFHRPALFHPMHAIVGAHFFCRFPIDRPTRGVWRSVLTALYPLGAVPFALAIWLQLTLVTQGFAAAAAIMTRHPVISLARGPLSTYLFYASLIVMVTALATNYRRLASEDQRRRVRWLVYGSIVALAPQIVVSALEVIAGIPVYARVGPATNVFTIVIPLVAAYAVVKHRVFDIKVVIRRGLQYLLARRVLQLAVALPLVMLGYTLVSHRHLTIAELAGDTRAYLYWLAAGGMALAGRRRIEMALDRHFFREEYDREQLLLGLLDEVRRVDSVARLAQVVSDRLMSAVHPTAAYIWYRDPGDLAAASSSQPDLTPAGMPSNDRWLSWLEQRAQVTVMPVPREAGLSQHDVGWFTERNISLIAPMMDSDDRLVGALLLGEKRSEEPYSPGDRKLLDAIGRQAAIVRENLRLRARVGEEVRVRHEVLARLDGRSADLLKECPACGGCFDGCVESCPIDGAALALSLPVTRTIDEKYRLQRVIGRGGMGAVYEAHDVRLDRIVAVKILPAHAFGQPSALRRFHREARAAARISHPNIIGLHDYGTLDHGGAYLVMERFGGSTLRDELNRRPVMAPSVAAEWFGPLLDGLAAAHAAGIVHRDLKPENVMGEQERSGGLAVKILDLGLAKLGAGADRAPATMTAEGTIMGTPAYMAPEQLLGRDLDARADLFSVGVMLIEALTAHRPFPADRHTRLSQGLAPWSGHLRGIVASDELHALLRRCLAVDPNDRVVSASALREALLPLLSAPLGSER
jgi:eukaryotic-like serine/threonine-protein kinase